MALTVLRVVLEASWKLFWVALTVFGVVLEATWQSSAWSWRPHGSRFGGFHEHLEFSEFKIWVTDLLRRSVLKDVSNEITVQVGSKEALCRVYDPSPPRVSLGGEDQEG